MSKNQIIVVVFCVLLGGALYLFTGHEKPTGHDHSGHDHVADATPAKAKAESLDINAYINEVTSGIADEATKTNIRALQKSEGYKPLMDAFIKLDKPLAVAYYAVKFAESQQNVKDFIKAGDYNAVLLETAPDDKARNFLSNNRVYCYQKAVAMDSLNTDNRIKLAAAYMEGGGPPMQGVSILLDIVRKDSNNADAQMMLGRFGIISAQYDKAIARFQKILYLSPQNEEALLGMAQAYEGSGNIAEAVSALEKFKKLQRDAETKKRVEEYILQLKQKVN